MNHLGILLAFELSTPKAENYYLCTQLFLDCKEFHDRMDLYLFRLNRECIARETSTAA